MLLIEQSILNEMINAVESQSEECCGFFFGHETDENRMITKTIIVRNSEKRNKCTNFEITSMDYLRAESIAEKEKLSLLGIYHSHPNHPAIPSEYDRWTAQPYFSYIIISVMNNKVDAVRSWQLDPQYLFQEETIDIKHS